MRLVDADALLKCIPYEDVNSRFAVQNAPTIDAVRVIRCKDCKYYKKTSDGISYCYDHDDDILWQDDDYCSRGIANDQKIE